MMAMIHDDNAAAADDDSLKLLTLLYMIIALKD